MDGVLNIDKPAGPTSHDVVDEIRRLFGQKRVGHAGTLDPMATGVLVLCLGKATRVVEHLMGGRKQYRAGIVLGRSTDTQDATGATVSESDASGITRDAFERGASGFVGRIEQLPPMVSAVKHEGRRLYKVAREGKTVERKPRPVDVYSIELLAFEPGYCARGEMLIECGSGTYIRTLCADIGSTLGCGAHMSTLRRTRVGRFGVDDAVTIEQLAEAKTEDRLAECVIDISDALDDIPAVSVDADATTRVLHGASVAIPCSLGPSELDVRILAPNGELIALGQIESADGEPILRPRKVLAELDQ